MQENLIGRRVQDSGNPGGLQVGWKTSSDKGVREEEDIFLEKPKEDFKMHWVLSGRIFYKDNSVLLQAWSQTACSRTAMDLYIPNWSCNIQVSHPVKSAFQQSWKTLPKHLKLDTNQHHLKN